jgi:hypothetical protein
MTMMSDAPRRYSTLVAPAEVNATGRQIEPLARPRILVLARRARGCPHLVIDGPFAETKEHQIGVSRAPTPI